jgi:superfamily I DNA/RNA helicase/RecB family exonuclease
MSDSKLTSAQQQAVEHDAGPLIVLAGPGTGKTSVIVHRIAHAIEHRGVDPERMCAMTFTNKAANELRERIGTIVGGSAADAVHAGTFHRFGFTILRRFADIAGLPPEPQLLDSAQQRRMFRELILDHGLFVHALARGMDSVMADAFKAISEFRNAGLTPVAAQSRLDTLLDNADLEEGPRAVLERLGDHVRLFGLFDKSCRDRGVLTVDDLITRPTELLRANEMVRDICRHDYAHLVVDEFQDLNRGQINLLESLCGPGEPDLCVVGDDDQAIYAFRGADQFAFRHFKDIWPSAEQINLTENWRSGQAVLDLANCIIKESDTRFDPNKIVEISPDHEPPRACVEAIDLADWRDDGETIAAMILLDRQKNPERTWSSYAVLARGGKDLGRIQTALELEKIPTVVARGAAIDQEPGVQDLLAWISIVLEPTLNSGVRRILTRPPFGMDASAAMRIEKAHRAAASRRENSSRPMPVVDWLEEHYKDDPEIGHLVRRLGEWTRLFRASAQTESADRTIARIITEAGLINADLPDARARTLRIEALVAVLRFVRERLPRLEQPRDLAAFMRYYSDLDDKEKQFSSRMEDSVNGPEDETPEADDGVRLITAHGAKGLEFDTVFLPRVQSNGYILTGRANDSPVPPQMLDMEFSPPSEEERRIFYVACTRAERRLVLLGKIPKKPGRTNFMGLILSNNLAVRSEAIDQMERAAEAGLGRYDRNLSGSQLELMRDPTRRSTLARVRQHIRSQAALALDYADRTPFDMDRLAEVQDRLRRVSTEMALLAAIASGETISHELDADAQDFAHSLRKELDATDDQAGSMIYRPQTPPLYLSYTAISEYLRCPRCYYVNRVLDLPGEEDTSLRIGSIAHKALEVFAKSWREADMDGRSPPGLDALEALGRTALHLEVDPGEPIDPEEMAKLIALLRVYYEQMHDPEAEPIEIETKHSFEYERNGHKHRLTAKIDRIDRTAQGIRIIDYKTGMATKKLLEPKSDDLQLGLYAMAARRMFKDDGLQGTAEYWVISTGQRGVINLADLDLEATRENINLAIDGILAGEFDQSKDCYGDCEIIDGIISTIDE